MKTLKTIFILGLLFSPFLSLAQNSKSDTVTYRKKVTRRTTTVGTTTVTDVLKDTINKENGPILNDNGSISTTGTIDGRSATGRPADEQTGYTVKRSKKTIRSGAVVSPDSTKRKKRKQ
ncbi:hypothetical protein [Dyadobacter psychrotolerans]|uniref:Uncharacterized protein n=1 Tax=Dyadobacter psychrotolerans TaxID=2541721 RepID=A0A4R5DSN6_9BACT|nr:hypothetical protein [Dyadobacter psychrotolerans]TDE15364.1 hypothetical protein E0F88_12690 [Dyadobacter psychrotolerans]